MSENNFIRPSLLIEKYPKVAKKWTANYIGVLLRMELIRGRVLQRGCEVDEFDVLDLFEKRKK